MKLRAFMKRNLLEMLRDPLNLMFGIAFPLALLLLFSAIQANIQDNIFVLEALVPGICVFGLTFISLFSGILISKDRSSSLLMRLYATPLTPKDYILGYTLPLLPMAVVQTIFCMLCSLVLGLEFSVNLILTIIVLIPIAIFFISFGLLAGSTFSDKQVGGICGALLTNLCAWLSGAWFDVRLVGGWFEKIAYLLPFAHAVDAGKAALAGNYREILPHLWWIFGYALVMTLIAILIFRKKMTSEKV